MKIRKTLFGLFCLTVGSFALWLWLIEYQNPYQADSLDLMAFYVTLFGWITGFLTFILFYLGLLFSSKEIAYSALMTALRHSIIISLIINGLLFFKMLAVLNTWTTVVYIFIVCSIEFFFLFKEPGEVK